MLVSCRNEKWSRMFFFFDFYMSVYFDFKIVIVCG